MKEPLVLIPGMMCDARVFGPQINDLSRDHTVIVAAPTQGDTVREMASLLLDQLPTRFALAGLSLGGIVAMEMARRAPDRVNRLALISTTPLSDTPAQAGWREPQIVRAIAGRLDEAMADAFSPNCLAPTEQRSEIMDLVYQMARDLGPELFVRQARALQRRSDAQRALQRLKIPTMVMCGAHDTLTPPKRHETMSELIQDAELVILPEAGHLPTLEMPEHVNIGLRAWMGLPLQLRERAIA
ncbi:Pimeloyl-ACP methyl ester carboxylesterase [Aliiroseovarius halocynthiae]|uniref:Alpha/beta fold hydrolase n=1 Tax=Aliiroseovarius halocynthiae TaxID=985055 RepID=A0A545SSG0_9RHOB|nr:alpha/beta fold hydrolase [Aliiroseovarius halocynthiae]TQV67892.1 alpha/beta fold hydrolase [Aliiroseovarius halocynthiae]SMR72987.1 Pimeloyl-ACP methyl ester carboxylesterase [Aliiroseovarius halocynthiae]